MQVHSTTTNTQTSATARGHAKQQALCCSSAFAPTGPHPRRRQKPQHMRGSQASNNSCKRDAAYIHMCVCLTTWRMQTHTTDVGTHVTQTAPLIVLPSCDGVVLACIHAINTDGTSPQLVMQLLLRLQLAVTARQLRPLLPALLVLLLTHCFCCCCCRPLLLLPACACVPPPW